MRFTRTQERWHRPIWHGKKNGFKFKYSQTEKGLWYATVTRINDGKVFNSLWVGTQFDTKDEIESWCENFKPDSVFE